jgi:hypothetical protein
MYCKRLIIVVLVPLILVACDRGKRQLSVREPSRAELFQLKRQCTELGLRERADEEARAADERRTYLTPIVSYDEQLNTCLYANTSRSADGSREMHVLDLLSREFLFNFDNVLDRESGPGQLSEFERWRARIRADAAK